MSRVRFARRAGSAFLLALAMFSLAVHGASASKYKKLYEFCAQAACADGSGPAAPLIQDAAGNLYGTTETGGDANQGTIFVLIKSKHWKYKRLYSFCALESCADGAAPYGRMVIDTGGNLYGVAPQGGPNDGGVIFELVGQKNLKILYAPCSRANCADGQSPSALTYQGAASGAAYDGISPLYGSNFAGGTNNSGMLFKLTPHGRKWRVTTLYRFCEPDCVAGRNPFGDLVIDGSGNIYGTAQANTGSLYKVDTAGIGTLLHTFCSSLNCTDGWLPSGGVLADATGALIGTTIAGGDFNAGVLFKYSSEGGYAVLREFCGICNTGNEPQGVPAMNAAGKLFGVTLFGGPNFGDIYEWDGTTLYTIFDLCGSAACGSVPRVGLTIDGAGNLFGTTQQGGTNNGGVVFEFVP